MVDLYDEAEQAIEDEQVEKIQFNPDVHQVTEEGDPKRKQDGTIQLKTSWKKDAKDRQGRTYNPQVHGESQVLDSQGYLKVRRRGAIIPIGTTNRTEAFVNKHKEEGYAYYLMNDEGGRIEQFQANDWEPVMTKDGRADMPVGQARSPGTQAVLMKKPIEWYEADQNAKIERNKARFEQTTSPKEEAGQYEATATSPLR